MSSNKNKLPINVKVTTYETELTFCVSKKTTGEALIKQVKFISIIVIIIMKLESGATLLSKSI